MNQKGQMTMEAILIITVLFGVVTLSVNLIRQQNVLARVVEQPWGLLGGMIENGVWTARQQGQVQHPNHLSRHASPEGDVL